MNNVTIITPTRDRPQQLSLVIDCINNQTVKTDKWVIIDDGPKALTKQFFANCTVPVEYEWHSKQFDNSVVQNSALAMQKVTTDNCIIIQDDDYYPPIYIQKVLNLLRTAQNTLLGNLVWRNYRLSTGHYKIYNGTQMRLRAGCQFQWHSAAFRGLELIKNACNVLLKNQLSKFAPDVLVQKLVQTFGYGKLIQDFGKASCISLKDYGTGTPGVVPSHRSSAGMLQDTQDYKIFKDWLGPDWIRYQKYLGRLR